MKTHLIIAILLMSMGPVCAQDAQPNAAKLKADAQKVVRLISHDKIKNQVYCQVTDLGDQIDHEKDATKAASLVEKMNELQKQLGPEYLALVGASLDLDSRDGREIIAMFNELEVACSD